MEPTNRYLALSLAVQRAGGSGDVVADAAAFLTFLDGGENLKDALGAPKAPRQPRKATAAAATDTAASVSTAAKEAAPAAAASPSDDLFGDDEPKAAEAPKKEEAAKKVKPPTQDDVRAALVAAQTALQSKDKAVDILAKHTTGGERVLSKLPESAFAALIKECNEAAANAPK